MVRDYRQKVLTLCLFQTILFGTDGFHKSGTFTDATVPSSDWETSMSALISRLTQSKPSYSITSDVAALFFPYGTSNLFQQLLDQAENLVDTSAPGFAMLMSGLTSLATNLQDEELSRNSSQTHALNGLISSCEDLFGQLVASPDVSQTFILGVPLAFLHLSTLRARFLTVESTARGETRNNLNGWLATYWQFIYDGCVHWKEWRFSQLQIGQWVQTAVIQNICNAMVSDELFSRRLIHIQMANCSGQSRLDNQTNVVLSFYRNQLDFQMMRILSKIFVLHTLVPGFEDIGPYPGNFSSILTLGPFQPLTYQVPRSAPFVISSLPETMCQPLTNGGLKGITNITVRQWNWVDGIQVLYENGVDRFQGNPAGGIQETMTFVPHTEKCLTSVKWTMSSTKNHVASVMFSARDGKRSGSRGGWRRKANLDDITTSTTAPLLYCITNVASCADSTENSNSLPAVTGFQVSMHLVNPMMTAPDHLIKGLTTLGNKSMVFPKEFLHARAAFGTGIFNPLINGNFGFVEKLANLENLFNSSLRISGPQLANITDQLRALDHTVHALNESHYALASENVKLHTLLYRLEEKDRAVQESLITLTRTLNNTAWNATERTIVLERYIQSLNISHHSLSTSTSKLNELVLTLETREQATGKAITVIGQNFNESVHNMTDKADELEHRIQSYNESWSLSSVENAKTKHQLTALEKSVDDSVRNFTELDHSIDTLERQVHGIDGNQQNITFENAKLSQRVYVVESAGKQFTDNVAALTAQAKHLELDAIEWKHQLAVAAEKSYIDDGAVYVIRGMCGMLDQLSEDNTPSATGIQIVCWAGYTDYPHQRFRVKQWSKDVYSLLPVRNENRIALGAGYYHDGQAKVLTEHNTGYASQRWKLIKKSDDHFFVQNIDAGMYMHAPGHNAGLVVVRKNAENLTVRETFEFIKVA